LFSHAHWSHVPYLFCKSRFKLISLKLYKITSNFELKNNQFCLFYIFLKKFIQLNLVDFLWWIKCLIKTTIGKSNKYVYIQQSVIFANPFPFFSQVKCMPIPIRNNFWCRIGMASPGRRQNLFQKKHAASLWLLERGDPRWEWLEFSDL
jgi:hypothetical protein